MFNTLWNDEAGAIVSGEIVLVMTFLVLGVLVGLVELQDAVVTELNDVADAIGSLNQSYYAHGKSSGHGCDISAFSAGSSFKDHVDDCDGNECDIVCDRPQEEARKGRGHR